MHAARTCHNTEKTYSNSINLKQTLCHIDIQPFITSSISLFFNY